MAEALPPRFPVWFLGREVQAELWCRYDGVLRPATTEDLRAALAIMQPAALAELLAVVLKDSR